MKPKQKYCKRGHDRTLPGAVDKNNRSCVQCIKARHKSKEYLTQRRDYYKISLKGEKHNKRHKTWASRNRDKTKIYRLKTLYGIRPEDIPDACEVCRSPASEGTIHVDHCHATGKVRGFLCGGCNRSLGMLKENPERIRQLAKYIEERNK